VEEAATGMKIGTAHAGPVTGEQAKTSLYQLTTVKDPWFQA
jgi:hypothetical protein